MRRQFNIRVLLTVLHDCAAVAAAWLATYALRFGTADMWPWLLANGPVLVMVGLVEILIFAAFGLYRGLWRYASLRDLRQLLIAVGVAAVCAPVVQAMVAPGTVLPRSTLLMHPVLLFVFLGAGRLAYLLWHDRSGLSNLTAGDPVVIIGAGVTGARLVELLRLSPRWRAVALADDDRGKQGRVVHGVPVLGPTAEAAAIAERTGARAVVMAIPSASHEVRRRIVDACREAGLEVLTVPSFDEILHGQASVDRIRRIEIDDLLGRDPVRLDDRGVAALLAGQVVMVTGAGGSIGSELCRQIARFEPSLLVAFDQNEFGVYTLAEEFATRARAPQVAPLVGDVCNRRRLDAVLQQYRPRVVFHAAAYKHVPLMEEVNAWEAVRNNAHGTLVAARAALEAGVETFVLVSTDKAVNPTNVMGASKRLAEIVCERLQGQGLTRFEVVRFGNVLGSTGSVIPKFQQQIARGGPVTVTHPEIIRYFMSIPEAAQLVLQAASMGRGGEIFVLDMGQPVRIVDLARDLIRLSGYTEQEIPIRITGLRPGEKLYEELLADGETTIPTEHPKLRVARTRPVDGTDLGELERWLAFEGVRSDAEVRRDLRRWIPEYAPAERPELRVVSGTAARR